MTVQREIGIIDCGISNLGSISRAILDLGFKPTIISDPSKLSGKSRLIFPGQGSFSEGMKRVHERNWFNALRHQVIEACTPILGIVLGCNFSQRVGLRAGW